MFENVQGQCRFTRGHSTEVFETIQERGRGMKASKPAGGPKVEERTELKSRADVMGFGSFPFSHYVALHNHFC